MWQSYSIHVAAFLFHAHVAFLFHVHVAVDARIAFCVQVALYVHVAFLYSFRFFTFRSIRPTVFRKKGVLKNFAKFIGKHLCQGLLFNNVAGSRPAMLLKKRLWHRSFPENFCNVLKKSFFIEHFWWLLWYVHVAVLYSAFFVLM